MTGTENGNCLIFHGNRIQALCDLILGKLVIMFDRQLRSGVSIKLTLVIVAESSPKKGIRGLWPNEELTLPVACLPWLPSPMAVGGSELLVSGLGRKGNISKVKRFFPGEPRLAKKPGALGVDETLMAKDTAGIYP